MFSAPIYCVGWGEIFKNLKTNTTIYKQVLLREAETTMLEIKLSQLGDESEKSGKLSDELAKASEKSESYIIEAKMKTPDGKVQTGIGVEDEEIFYSYVETQKPVWHIGDKRIESNIGFDKVHKKIKMGGYAQEKTSTTQIDEEPKLITQYLSQPTATEKSALSKFESQPVGLSKEISWGGENIQLSKLFNFTSNFGQYKNQIKFSDEGTTLKTFDKSKSFVEMLNPNTISSELQTSLYAQKEIAGQMLAEAWRLGVDNDLSRKLYELSKYNGILVKMEYRPSSQTLITHWLDKKSFYFLKSGLCLDFLNIKSSIEFEEQLNS
jgi:hypothetical protein